jgi:hypothetical protein
MTAIHASWYKIGVNNTGSVFIKFFPKWIRTELTRQSITDSLASVTRLLPAHTYCISSQRIDLKCQPNGRNEIRSTHFHSRFHIESELCKITRVKVTGYKVCHIYGFINVTNITQKQAQGQVLGLREL